MNESHNGHSSLIALRDPRSLAAEAYRTLRTNIQFSSLDKPLHTLLATSTAPDEGKSTTLANLAVTMAQAEQRVIHGARRSALPRDLSRAASGLIHSSASAGGRTASRSP